MRSRSGTVRRIEARHRIDKMNITLDANAPLDRSRWGPA